MVRTVYHRDPQWPVSGPVDVPAWEWAVLVVAAVAVGFAKTAIAGVATLAVVGFALVIPARESTGTLLPLLIAADVAAVTIYRRHADWPLLLGLLPWVGIGVAVGVAFLAAAGDLEVRRVIGALILAGVIVAVWLRRQPRDTEGALQRPPPGRRVAGVVGIAAGFASMAANAAGPLMVLYLLLAGLPVKRFVGTAAWFFLIVNLVKVPFSAGLGLIDGAALRLDLILLPALALGAWAGVVAIRHISQLAFERAALVLAAVSCLPLLR